MAQKLTREDLLKLDKHQLIAFILKNFQKTTPDEKPPACNAASPPGFDGIKLPAKPPTVLCIASPAKDAAPKLPPIPKTPPIPDVCNDFTKKKKKVVPPEMVEGEKRVFVKCERCDKTFIIDLPKRIVLSNPNEVVPVTLLHAEDHALTVYLDQNFESRRDYVSEIFRIK